MPQNCKFPAKFPVCREFARRPVRSALRRQPGRSAYPEIADETGLAGELLRSSTTHHCCTGFARTWLSTPFAVKPSTIGGAVRLGRHEHGRGARNVLPLNEICAGAVRAPLWRGEGHEDEGLVDRLLLVKNDPPKPFIPPASPRWIAPTIHRGSQLPAVHPRGRFLAVCGRATQQNAADNHWDDKAQRKAKSISKPSVASAATRSIDTRPSLGRYSTMLTRAACTGQS